MQNGKTFKTLNIFWDEKNVSYPSMMDIPSLQDENAILPVWGLGVCHQLGIPEMEMAKEGNWMS